MRNIEVTVRNEAHDVEACVQVDAVEDNGVGMALMRAVAAACVTVGEPIPEDQYRRVTGIYPSESAGVDRSEIVAILEQYGYPATRNTVGPSVCVALADLKAKLDAANHGSLMLAALGPKFAETLAQAREAYALGALAGRHLDDQEFVSNAEAKPTDGQVRALRTATSALGSLLFEMNKVETQVVQHMDDSGTGSVTQSVVIGEGGQ